MDAKMRADFVNSVASGQKVPCPVCNTLNDPDGSFCIACGHSLKIGGYCTMKQPDKQGFRFCTVCGNKLDEAESTKSSDPVTPQPAAAPAQSKAAGQQPAAPAQDVQRNMGKNASQVAPAFEPAKKTAAAPIRKDPLIQSKPVRKKMAFNFAEPEVEEYQEPVSVFAQGLPSWDVVPPQIMVRRKKKK